MSLLLGLTHASVPLVAGEYGGRWVRGGVSGGYGGCDVCEAVALAVALVRAVRYLACASAATPRDLEHRNDGASF
jgi:hypothetical protein